MYRNNINYKQKYQELKMKFMESVDAAFRLGFEQGALQSQQDQVAQQDQMAQQQQMQQQAQQDQMNTVQPGQEQPEQEQPEQEQPEQEQPEQEQSQLDQGGSELDQHIATLESMVSNGNAQPEEIQKALHNLKSFRQNQLQEIELQKSAKSISAISQALHKPAFKLGVQASHNMTSNSKQALGMQHKIVEDILNKWEQEEQKATHDIKDILNIEGLFKKE